MPSAPPPPQCLKVGIVESEEMAFARQQLSKYNPVAMNTVNNTELLGTVFSVYAVLYQVTQYVVKGM